MTPLGHPAVAGHGLPQATRAFLDSLTTKTLALGMGKMETYSGNYSFYEREKVVRKELQMNAFKNQQKQIEQTEKFIDRFRWTTVDETGIEQLMFPLHIDGEDAPVPTQAPTVGQHSEDVLRRVLGYDDAGAP